MGEFGDQLLVAEWHTSGEFCIPGGLERASFYNVSGVPHVCIDGKYSAIGAGSCSGAAGEYRWYINQRLSETGGVAPVAIDGMYVIGATEVSVTATFTLDDAVTLLSPTAYILILEDSLVYLGDEYNHIVRAEHHEPVSLVNPGDDVTIEAVFEMGSAWNPDNLKIVAFLQKMEGDQEIYNSAPISPMADFTFAFSVPLLSVPQGSGTAEFTGILVNTSGNADEITCTLDNTFGWPAEFKIEGEAGFHTTPSIIGLESGEMVDVYLRVYTDAELRIGEGSLIMQSAQTSRTQITSAEVFNGSPAVLLVDDDDGVYATEEAFQTAMDEAGYLYHTWDVQNAHAAQTPGYEEMRAYDLLVWINGWEDSALVTEEDANQLMQFMNTGKGLLLSSQDFLNGFTPGDLFLTDYLGIHTWNADVGASLADGVPGDPISDGMSLVVDYPSPQLNRGDEVHASTIGTEILRNETSRPIAIRADNGTCHTVTLTFGGAGVEPGAFPNNLATLVDRALNWIYAAQGQGVEEVLAAPSSRIGHIAPNPFSLQSGINTATIRLRLSDRAARQSVSLEIVDLNGRLVRTIVRGALPSGINAVTWSGHDVAGHPVGAGVYCARLTTADGIHGARLVVLR